MIINSSIYSSKTFFYQADYLRMAKAVKRKKTTNTHFDLFVSEQLSLSTRIVSLDSANGKSKKYGDLFFAELDPVLLSKKIDHVCEPIIKDYPEKIVGLLEKIVFSDASKRTQFSDFSQRNPILKETYFYLFQSIYKQGDVSNSLFQKRILNIRHKFERLSNVFSVQVAAKCQSEKKLFVEADKLLKKYIDAIDLKAKIEPNRLFAMITVGRFNVLNLCIKTEVVQSVPNGCFFIDKKTESAAHKLTNEINHVSNSISAFFSFIDLNDLFDLPPNTILQKMSNGLKPVPKQGAKKSLDQSAYYFVFSKFSKMSYPYAVFDSKKMTFEKNIKRFFHLFSISSCYYRDFSEIQLTEEAYSMVSNWPLNNNPFGSPFHDLIPTGSIHFYQSGSRFFYGVLEFNRNGEIFLEDSTTANSKSHAFRYVGDDNQRTIQSSIIYGSMTLAAGEMIEGAAVTQLSRKHMKFFRLMLIHWYVRQSGSIRLIYNSESFYEKKDRKELCEAVMCPMGVDYMEKKSRITSEILWQEANITNAQKYGKITSVISLSSLLLSIVTIGFVVTVTCLRHPKDNFGSIINVLFNSKYVILGLVFASIPLCLELLSILIDYFVGKYFTLLKWLGIKRLQ